MKMQNGWRETIPACVILASSHSTIVWSEAWIHLTRSGLSHCSGRVEREYKQRKMDNKDEGLIRLCAFSTQAKWWLNHFWPITQGAWKKDFRRETRRRRRRKWGKALCRTMMRISWGFWNKDTGKFIVGIFLRLCYCTLYSSGSFS